MLSAGDRWDPRRLLSFAGQCAALARLFDGNDNGYQFWLTKLNMFGGNFTAAEMVKPLPSPPSIAIALGRNLMSQ